MYWNRTLLTTLFVVLLSASGLAGAAQITVRDAIMATEIADRLPHGVGVQFDATVGEVYAFTRIVGAEGDTRVRHKWYFNDQLMADIPLSVRSNNWRTWSSKKVLPEWSGDWRVEVVSEDGSVIEILRFSVI